MTNLTVIRNKAIIVNASELEHLPTLFDCRTRCRTVTRSARKDKANFSKRQNLAHNLATVDVAKMDGVKRAAK